MNLYVIGLNHKTAPISLREKLSFAPHKIIQANQALKEAACLEEVLILSTCNRVEIYAVTNGFNCDYIARIKSFLSQYHKIDLPDFEDRLYVYKNEESAQHLFKVSAGLDSMVIGEPEILGQVKKAYQIAVESKTTGKVLNRLLHKTFTAAKIIRRDTFITRGAVSVSSVAVKLAEELLGSLKNKNVLIIGAGKISEQMILYLKKRGIKDLLIANRTFEKAKNLAQNFGAQAIKFENFAENLIETDIVIASTGAPHTVILKEDIAPVMLNRKNKPIFLIDLAVPRDISPAVGEIDNVYLRDIDDIKKIADQNIKLRKSELDSCREIITKSSRHFIEWFIKEFDLCATKV